MVSGLGTQCSPWPDDLLNVHGLLSHSRINGPGVRAVIWLQGCNRRCPGCFNKDAQPREPRRLCTPEEIWEWLSSQSGIEGVTISGGEPLLQIKPLGTLLGIVRSRSDLSVVVYSGYTLEEARLLPGGPAMLAFVDVLIDGPYDQTQPAEDGLRGSQNQRIHLLTDRYRHDDLMLGGMFEVVVLPDGTMVRTGVAVRPRSPGGSASPPDR